VAEWLKAPVLKTGEPKGSGGSNPSPSASPQRHDVRRKEIDEALPVNGIANRQNRIVNPFEETEDGP
jgi:hypothetical protein